MSEAYILIRPDSSKEQPAQITLTFQPTKYQTGSVHGSVLQEVIDTATASDTSFEAFINRRRIRELKHQKTHELIRIILEEDFEYGFNSPSDLFIIGLMEVNPSITREWLNSVFIEYFHDTRVVIGLLHIISHLEYYQIYPQGPTMAIAALSHVSAEVRECGIRAFENWGMSESLNVLKNVRCAEKWLQEYVEQVVSDLEDDLGGHVSAC
ncbi:MAG: hypothetical protein RKP73_19090 [Candidatus Contendobacter sp.]|nr:hypothetical protein [Candidatus Contendobacter sp.]